MLAYERRTELLDALKQTGTIAVRHIARQLGVSEVTIRSDLVLLERQGCLRRVHGGAILAKATSFNSATTQSEATDRDVVATRAAAMVVDGESIVVTAGRLGLLLAHELSGRKHLNVITDSLEVAQTLAQERTNTVIITGGVVSASGAMHIDAVTPQNLGHLKATRAFVATPTISASAGLLEESLNRAATLRILIGLADSLVVLLDGEDGTGQGLVIVVSPDEVEHVIVQNHVSAALVDGLRAAGITVSLCGSTVITVPPRASNTTVYKVAFANLSETELFTVEVRRSIERAAHRAGNIELLLADNHVDGETALRNAEHFIAQRVDLVIEYQVDESYAYRLMHRLRLARIPVISIDIPHPGAIYFGVDNYIAGRMAGDAIASEIIHRWDGRLDRLFSLALPRSGQIVAARLQGQIDAIGESVPLAPGQITWLDSRNTYQTAYQILKQVLPEIDIGQRLAVIAVNDETMLGAIAALEETGHSAYAIGVSQGADRLALVELLRPGTPLIGAVAFQPETYGDHLVALALDVLTGKEVPPAVYQQHHIIRPADAQSYLSLLQSRDSEGYPFSTRQERTPVASRG